VNKENVVPEFEIEILNTKRKNIVQYPSDKLLYA